MAMDVRTGIIEAAQALGMNPVDLATIISYETGGTFNASATNPDGQHRGLLQFGAPEQQQYGVNWQDPVGSQLGANGAVVRYFRDRGYKPGMPLNETYSIVNAGSPGHQDAVDGTTTVAQKVASMQPHQAKAQALLGGSTPAGAQGPGYAYDFPAPAAAGEAPPPPAAAASPDFGAYNAIAAEQANDPYSGLAQTLGAATMPRSASPSAGLAGGEEGMAPAPDFASAAPSRVPFGKNAWDAPPDVGIDSTPLSGLFKVKGIKDIGQARAMNADSQGNPVRRRTQG
jgi:hypothetical protein